jgi:hypothetical protein
MVAGLAVASQGLGRRGDRWVAGTLLPDGTYLDDYVEPGPLEWIRERWHRKRREYVIGVDLPLPPDVASAITAKRGSIPMVAAAGDLSEALGAVGASTLLNFHDVAYHPGGLAWPPDSA